MNKYSIATKLRGVIEEFGKNSIKDAIIVGPEDLLTQVCGHKYIQIPTIAQITLGNVSWKVSRYFEDYPL